MQDEELDLAIPDMDSQTSEEQVKKTLEALPGILAVRIIERGAFIRHRRGAITNDEICIAIRQLGLRVSIFQDSSGRQGKSSQ